MLLFLETNLIKKHLQGVKTGKDSPELFENFNILEDVYTLHNFVPFTFEPNEIALEKLDEPTPFMNKDYTESKVTNQCWKI